MTDLRADAGPLTQASVRWDPDSTAPALLYGGRMEGWPSTPCPACQEAVQPGQEFFYAPAGYPDRPQGNGDVHAWHPGCLVGRCPHCDATHRRPFLGRCLI